MKIAICEDEKEYRKLLSDYIAFYFNEKCIDYNCFEFSSGETLLSSNKTFDIVFLDIEMNKLDGIQTAKEINKKNRNTVIFIVTAYQKYLDEAMDLNVFRYIDKPINAKRIYSGLDKAIELINNNVITFNTRSDGIVKIFMSDIICVEVSHKTVYVSTVNKKYIAREKLDFFKQKLNASYFVIPHNSYVVNMNYIVGLKRKEVKLSNGQIVNIAPKKQTEVRKKFISFMGENYGSLSDDF